MDKKKAIDSKKAPPSEPKRKMTAKDEKEKKVTEQEGGTPQEDERIYTWIIRYDESHFNEAVFFEHSVEATNKIEAVNSWLTHLFRTGLLTVVKQEKGTGVNPYI